MQQSSKLRGMMIDIETLDTKRTSVVIQIGAVVFDYDQYGTCAAVNEFLVSLPIVEQVRGGRTTSTDTVAFWMSADNHKMLASIIDDVYTTSKTVEDLKTFFDENPCDRYWFQGPTFDAIILEDLLDSVPWKFFQVRDQRTVDDLAIDKDKIKEFKATVNHDALADCHNQIDRLMFCLSERKPALAVTAPCAPPEFIPSGSTVADQFSLDAATCPLGDDGLTGGSP